MTLDWPIAAVIVAAFGAVVALARPYVVGRSADKARAAVLDDLTKRLNAVESHLGSGSRKWPGRL